MDIYPDEHIHPGSEGLEWGSELAETTKGAKPNAKYNKFSDKARGMIKGESQCAVFCGGKKCKYCTDRKWKTDQMAIKGLFSHWVTDNILAMARPSEESLDKHKILDQFEEVGIKSVINLQTPGEHAQCGNGNLKSGFSYDPQTLMEHNMSPRYLHDEAASGFPDKFSGVLLQFWLVIMPHWNECNALIPMRGHNLCFGSKNVCGENGTVYCAGDPCGDPKKKCLFTVENQPCFADRIGPSKLCCGKSPLKVGTQAPEFSLRLTEAKCDAATLHYKVSASESPSVNPILQIIGSLFQVL